MDGQFEKIHEILVRIPWGEITSEERQTIENWRKEDQRNEQLYQRLINDKAVYIRLQALEETHIEKAFFRNQKLLQRRNFRRVIRRSIPYAALLMVMIGLALLWVTPPRQEISTSAVCFTEPGTHQAELVLANGSSIHLSADMQETVQDGNAEVFIKENTVNYSDAPKSRETSWHIVRTPLGGEYSITLSDGTRVWLNAMSELKYPVCFEGNKRQVELKGEAYFQVRPDTTKPFYVRMGDYQVEVLGTSFNVKAYEEDECWQTTLCSGKVNLSDLRNNQTLILAPGKQGICNRKTRQLDLKEVDTGLFTAWTKGEFRFDNTPVEDLFTVLQRWYKIEVFYMNSQARQEVFTGKLPRFDNLQVILNIMEKVSELQFEMKGNTVFIK